MATREEYNACVSEGLKGKKLGKEERQQEFCIVAKLCSGKAQNRAEADALCSQPKEPKPSTKSSAGGSTSGRVRIMPSESGILIKKGRSKIEISEADYRKICPCQFEE